MNTTQDQLNDSNKEELLYFCGAAVRAFACFYERAHEIALPAATQQEYDSRRSEAIALCRFQISSVRSALEIKFGYEKFKDVDELMPPPIPRPASIDNYSTIGSLSQYEIDLNDQVALWIQKREQLKNEDLEEEEEEEEEGEEIDN